MVFLDCCKDLILVAGLLVVFCTMFGSLHPSPVTIVVSTFMWALVSFGSSTWLDSVAQNWRIEEAASTRQAITAALARDGADRHSWITQVLLLDGGKTLHAAHGPGTQVAILQGADPDICVRLASSLPADGPRTLSIDGYRPSALKPDADREGSFDITDIQAACGPGMHTMMWRLRNGT
jgi:hypothetical protein